MLLNDIRRFCEAKGLPPTKFGRLAVNDPRLIGDMARGRCLGPRVAERVQRFMADRR